MAFNFVVNESQSNKLKIMIGLFDKYKKEQRVSLPRIPPSPNTKS